jgi:hypothetical protein
MKTRSIEENYRSMVKSDVGPVLLAKSPVTKVYNLRDQIIEEYEKVISDSKYSPEIKLYESDTAVQVLKQDSISNSLVHGEAQRQFTKNHSKKISKRGFDISVRGVFQSVEDESGNNYVFDQQHSLTALLDNANGDVSFTVPFATTRLKETKKLTVKDLCAFGYDCVNNKSKKSNPVENFYIGLHSGTPSCVKIYEHLDNLELDVMEKNYKVFPEYPNRYSVEGFALFAQIYSGKTLAPWVKYMKKSVNILRECYNNSAYSSVATSKGKLINTYDMKGVAYLLYRVSECSDKVSFSLDHLMFSIKSYWNRHDEMLKIDGEKMNRLNTPKVSGLWEESVAYNYVLRAYNRFAKEQGVDTLPLKLLFPNVDQAYNPVV